MVGLCEVARGPYADHTAWDPKSKYHDPKASPDDDPPRWAMVDVKLVRVPQCTCVAAQGRSRPRVGHRLLFNYAYCSMLTDYQTFKLGSKWQPASGSRLALWKMSSRSRTRRL